MENKKGAVTTIKKNRTIWVVSIISLTVVALIYNHNKTEENSTVGIPELVAPEKPIVEINKVDSSVLIGRWKRSDGGYVIEIRKTEADGRLDAGYFNPEPINIGRALWATKDNRLIVLVELRDKNYPGSTYGLEYVKKEDKLYGKYYQAVEKTTYDVDFIREK